ncbi:MAG: hypothetical protein WAV02_08555 [Stellaceae bacterium]
MRKVMFAGMLALGRAMALAGAAQADPLSNQDHPEAALQQKLDLLDHGSDASDAPPAVDADKGSFPRSWRIPGTNTSIRVYGSGTETLQYSR